jgi:hypothetical protein
MTKDHQGSHEDNDPNKVDPWVQSQLSAYHVLWLEKQGDVMNKTELLKYALAEWVVRHPSDWFRLANVGGALWMSSLRATKRSSSLPNKHPAWVRRFLRRC